jgi:hypothetical protein
MKKGAEIARNPLRENVTCQTLTATKTAHTNP